MRIGIDLRFLVPGQVGGSENYARNLTRVFGKIDPVNQYTIFTNHPAAQITPLQGFNNFQTVSLAGPRGLRRVWDRVSMRDPAAGERMVAEDLDVMFFPGVEIAPKNIPIPAVNTVHDIQHAHYPQFFSYRERFRRWRREKPSIFRADAVIAVSEHTRRSLLEAYALPMEKVVTVYSGVDYDYFGEFSKQEVARVRKKYRLPEIFIFYPARFWPHKNHTQLFAALRLLQTQHQNPVRLILCGEPRTAGVKLESHSGLTDQVQTLGYVPDADLRALLHAAAVLVFPSLYEGFGLPVLEAMAAGCPVACSNLTALPEIAEECALYFDPHDPEDIASSLQRLLTDETLRTELVQQGKNRARMFPWEKTARKTLQVLQAASQMGSQATVPGIRI